MGKEKKARRIDWEAVEVDYRAGIKTLRQIGEEHKVSHCTIIKRAKRDGWVRDLTEKIKAKARDKVTRASVTSTVTKETEDEVVEAEAELQSRIALGHRKDIPAKRELVGKLFAEIEAMTDGADLLGQVRIALASDDTKDLAKVVKKICSLPSRIKGTSDLVNSYKALIMLERQAFNLDDENAAEIDLPRVIKRIIVRPGEDG